MHAVSSDQLVARAKRGDTVAFGALVEAHSRDVFRLAFRMTRNEEDAEDVVQETFLRAYQTLGRFEERASFGTWVYRITANTSIDLMRRRKRHETRRVPLDEAPSGRPGDQERVVYGRQVRDRVDDALEELSELERAAFILRHCEQRPLAEISEALAISSSATKQAVFRAVRKLRNVLAAFPRTAP